MSGSREWIAPEEFVFRRIHKNQVAAGPPVVVNFVGFRPTSEDKEGLSVYRERLTTAEALANRGRKAGEYYVARLSVRELNALGLSVVADEQTEGPAGHALIPELSLEACRIDKARLREVQIRLAELACGKLVVYPTS